MHTIMEQLNLPTTNLNILVENEMTKVFDPCRKKYVKLTPEEYVRQSFLAYMITHLNYPSHLIATEALVCINGLRQRADIIVYNRNGNPHLIVECKATTVKLTENVMQQALRYNIRLNVQYIVVTNGIQHYCAQIVNGQCKFINSIPQWGV